MSRDWPKIMRDFELSGLRPTFFCRKHGIPISSFYGARSRYGSCVERVFAPVSVKEQEKPESGGELQLSFFESEIVVSGRVRDSRILDRLFGRAS